MSQYQVVFEFSSPSYISDMSISRLCDQGILTAWFQIEQESDFESDSIELKGVNDLGAISAILQADRLIISEELNCQREFGSIKVQCWDDTDYSEFWCDSYSKE